MSGVRRVGVRERNRLAVRTVIAEEAMRLFLDRGFTATTVDQIAEAADVSRRTFFHYFPTKEDVVLGDTDALGVALLRALEARPDGETAWEALKQAFRALEGDADVRSRRVVARMYHDTPSLRARHLEKNLRWQELLAPEVARRLGVSSTREDPRPRAVVAAALGCLDLAIDSWQASEDDATLERTFDLCSSALVDALVGEAGTR